MKKIFLGVGGILLASLGVLAGRESAKFANAPALYVSDGAGICVSIVASAPGSHFTTTGTNQATIKTTNGINNRKVFYTSTCNTAKVYFN